MAFHCEVIIIGDSGGLAHTDLADLNQALRRNINSACGYQPPIELAVKRLGAWDWTTDPCPRNLGGPA